MPSRNELRAAKIADIKQQVESLLAASGDEDVRFLIYEGKRGLTKVEVRGKLAARKAAKIGTSENPAPSL